jgi:signal transduction histidine kinase
MQRGTVDLARIGAEVAEEMRRRYPGHPVDYSGPERMPAEGDPRMLRLMLETLFDNAWKFTGRRTDARVELGIAGDGSGACFVRDNGAGFDMAYADRLFAPFQRLHPEEEFPGTGIGLATVRRIVNRHGGRIWAAGAPGEGAVFHFTLRPGGACGPGEGKEAR